MIKVARASSGMAPCFTDCSDIFGSCGDAVDDGFGDGVNFGAICELSTFACTGFDDDVVAINEGETDDDDAGTESGADDGTTTFFSENCGGNGPDSTTSSRGTAFNIGESENEDASARC
mmetsp:Transcript_20511/g.30893  ORF Transcript_20511/g.30893 Transcript_20511/m.30893 type:complete len:119 (-) Transcript_20511:114-470(-)